MAISALSALALGWSCALQPLALQTPALRRNGCQQPLALQTPPHRLDGRLTAISPVARVPRARSPVALEPNELIDQAVAISTFAPQPFWLLMIALPRARVTRALMEPLAPILGLSLVHFAVVVTAASQQDGTAPITIFFDVFDPAQNQLDGMERLFSFRNFVAEEWPHVLIWDLFVGRAIWLDGVNRGFPIWLMAPAITLTNFIGPPGLLLHALFSVGSGRGLPQLGSLPDEKANE